MRRMRTILGLALMAAAAAAQATEAVLELRPEVYVQGPALTLSDVAYLSGGQPGMGGIEVGNAALPGQSVTLQAGLIVARLEQAGYPRDTFELTGSGTVRAVTNHTTVGAAQLEASLREFIESAMPYAPDEARVEVQAPAVDIVLPAGDITYEWQPAPRYRYLGNGAFHGAILVDGVTRRNVICRADIEAYRDVVVAVRDIPRGDPVSASDVALEEHALSLTPRGAATSLDEVVGLVARKTVFPGTVLTGAYVTPATLVRRNQLVAVEARAGSLMVRTTARARQDGAAGDTIRLQNVESREEFWGTVRDDGVVAVD